MKALHYYDVGFDCKAVEQASTEEEVLQQAAVHAQEIHGVAVTLELAKQLKTLIKDEKSTDGISRQ